MVNPHLEQAEAAAKADATKAIAYLSAKGNLYPFLIGAGACLVAVKVLHLLGLFKLI